MCPRLTEINIYSQSESALGKWMSNWTLEPIVTEDGRFASIEGYWYWLGCKNDKLRELHGFEAKRFGRLQQRVRSLSEEEFRKKIFMAIDIKIEANPAMKEALIKSELPFKHYYVYSGNKVNAGFQWLVDYWTNKRKQLKEIT